MALFSRKKEETTDAPAAKAKAPVAKALPTDRDLSSVLVKPRVTEKTVAAGDRNVYTFIVRRDATKYDVKDAIKAAYGVTPVKVNIVNKDPRQYLSRSKGRKVSEAGMKKAYVYLKDGDTISLV